MKNILLPTDFSENSRNAVAYAMQFFRETPCTFHLLHISPPTDEGLNFGHLNMPESVKEEFQNIIKWINDVQVNPDHHFSTCYKVNFFIEAIREKVFEKNITLILMGTKGASNEKEIILGKNTSDVIMKVKCPTLAISENAVFQPHKEILFPTDYKIRYSSGMLNSLKNIAETSKTTIKVLELFSSNNEPGLDQIFNKQALMNSLSPDIPEIQTFYALTNADPESLFLTNRNVDMIVMAAKNLNLCQKLLKDHRNQHIPFIRKLPLLILHD